MKHPSDMEWTRCNRCVQLRMCRQVSAGQVGRYAWVCYGCQPTDIAGAWQRTKTLGMDT